MQDELLSVGMSSALVQEVEKQADIPKQVTEMATPVASPVSKEVKVEPSHSQSDNKSDTLPKEPDFDPDEYSGAALLALELQKDGLIPKDSKIDKSLSTKDLRKLAKESFKKDVSAVENEIKQEILAKGYDEEDLRFAKLLRQGVPQEDLSSVAIYRQMGSINLDKGVEDLEEVLPDYLTQYYKDSGVKDAKAIKKLVEADMDEDGGEEKAKEAKTFYNQLADKEMIRLDAEAKAREKATQDQELAKTSSIKQTISKGKIGPYELTEDDKSDFEKYLFDNSEEVVGNDGKKYQVPAYYKDLTEYNNNVEQQLMMAYLMKKKFSLEDVKAIGKEEDKKDLLDYLDNQTKKHSQEAKQSQTENFKVLLRT